MEIQGKTAIITGASGGIGEALAEALTDRGANVVLLARRADLLAAVAKRLGSQAVAVSGDVTSREDLNSAVRAAEERFGRMDILINNAGVAVVGPLATMPEELMERGYRVNVFGPVLALQAALPSIKRQGGGLIVNVSSGMSLRPAPTMAIYASTKAALNLISATMREELREDNIHVITVHPGYIGNDFGANSVFSDDADAASRITSSQSRSQRTSADAARDIVAAMEADELVFRHNARDLVPPL